MSKWSQSRVVCLGDTAYDSSPLTGMGTSLALIGAYVLSGELSRLKDGEHPSRALDAYERSFRPFVEEAQMIPSVVPGIGHPKTAWRRWLLHVLVSTLSRIVAIPWVASKLGNEESDDGFPLPRFSKLDDEGSE